MNDAYGEQIELIPRVEDDLSSVPVREMVVEEVGVQSVATFIERHHYSGNVNGISSKHSFRMMHGGVIAGAAIFGTLAMANQWRRYVSREDDIIELRRLACIERTRKNAESYLIGACLRWLKKHTTYSVVISYADETHGHDGTIYKATNFRHVGMTQPGRMILHEGRMFHDKTIRTVYEDPHGNRRLKPYARALRDALEAGTAEWVKTKGKHIYVYDLR